MHSATNLSSSKTVYPSQDETLCDSFERAEYSIPHGCLAGSCGVCLIEIVEGANHLNTAKTIEKDTLDSFYNRNEKFLGKDIRLACKARFLNTGDVKFTKV